LYVAEQLCSRVIWLEKGQIRMNDTPAQVLPAYLDMMDRKLLAGKTQTGPIGDTLKINRVTFAGSDGIPSEDLIPGEDLLVQVHYSAGSGIECPYFVLAVSDAQGGPPLVLASMLADNQAPEKIAGEGVLTCRFKKLPLQPRSYQLWAEVWDQERIHSLIHWQRLGSFHIGGAQDEDYSRVGKGGIRHLRADAPVRVSYEWKLDS
jgi:hypothetical protein